MKNHVISVFEINLISFCLFLGMRAYGAELSDIEKNQQLVKLLNESYQLTCDSKNRLSLHFNLNDAEGKNRVAKASEIIGKMHYLRNNAALLHVLKWADEKGIDNHNCISSGIAYAIPLSDMNKLLEKGVPTWDKSSSSTKAVEITYLNEIAAIYSATGASNQEFSSIKTDVDRLKDLLYEKYKNETALGGDGGLAMMWSAQIADLRVFEKAKSMIAEFKKNRTILDKARFWLTHKKRDYLATVAAICMFHRISGPPQLIVEANIFLTKLEQDGDTPKEVKELIKQSYDDWYYNPFDHL